MNTADAKLAHDLDILTAMADEMEDYMKSDVLFWQMMPSGMPKLTLGGYLMREHRLLALREQLNAAEQDQLDMAARLFAQTMVERIVRLEQKAHQEIEARIRQWAEYLKDLDWEGGVSLANYPSAVETRAMMAALVDKLSTPPYRLDPAVKRQVGLLDGNLRRRWQSGTFVWPEAWASAYPQREYWWLYGLPQKRSR